MKFRIGYEFKCVKDYHYGGNICFAADKVYNVNTIDDGEYISFIDDFKDDHYVDRFNISEYFTRTGHLKPIKRITEHKIKKYGFEL